MAGRVRGDCGANLIEDSCSQNDARHTSVPRMKSCRRDSVVFQFPPCLSTWRALRCVHGIKSTVASVPIRRFAATPQNVRTRGMSRLVILALGLAARDRKPSWLSVRSEWTTIFAVSLTCLSSGTLPLVQPKRLEHVRLLPFHAWMARALQLDVLGLPVGHSPMRLQHRLHSRDSRNQ